MTKELTQRHTARADNFGNFHIVVTGFGQPSDAMWKFHFCMREKIAQYLTYDPRNKLIFAPSLDQHLQSVDVGFELSKAIESDLTSKHLPMIAEDCLNNILLQSIKEDKIIGDYIAIENWGILFEPALKLNLVSIFDSHSKSNVLILVNCGQADYEKFHLVSKHFNTTFPIGNLNPYILQ